jgi:hypothetical protein
MTMDAKAVSEYRRKLKEGQGSGGNQNWYSITEGTHYFRIGPPWTKGGEIWKDVIFHGHWSKSGQTKVFCGHNEINKETGKPRKCAVCRRLKALRNEPRTAASKKLFGFLIPRSEALWNVLVAKTKKDETGKVIVRGYADNAFKILRLTKSWHLELVELFADDEYRAQNVLGLTDYKTGSLIRCIREGSGMNDTEYKFKPVGKPCPIAKDKETRIALKSTLHDLDALVHSSSNEELQAYVHAMEKRAKKEARLEKEQGPDDESIDDDEDTNEDDE